MTRQMPTIPSDPKEFMVDSNTGLPGTCAPASLPIQAISTAKIGNSSLKEFSDGRY
jgi:hypothetical protein